MKIEHGKMLFSRSQTRPEEPLFLGMEWEASKMSLLGSSFWNSHVVCTAMIALFICGALFISISQNQRFLTTVAITALFFTFCLNGDNDSKVSVKSRNFVILLASSSS